MGSGLRMPTRKERQSSGHQQRPKCRSRQWRLRSYRRAFLPLDCVSWLSSPSCSPYEWSRNHLPFHGFHLSLFRVCVCVVSPPSFLNSGNEPLWNGCLSGGRAGTCEPADDAGCYAERHTLNHKRPCRTGTPPRRSCLAVEALGRVCRAHPMLKTSPIP
jgi:hypothetical protein